MAPETVFIVNPRAGNGTTGRKWPGIRKVADDLLGSFEICLTAGPGDATRTTREKIRRGAERIICVGGDGTLNEVVNGFFDEGGPVGNGAVLGFLPAGTGCDFARALPFPPGVGASIRAIRAGHVRTIDLGRIRFRNHQGGVSTRYFHNIASFGLGGEVAERVNRASKAPGPFITFLRETLVSLFSYKAKRVHLRIDDKEQRTVDVLNVAVANGRYHGGGMLVAPEAEIDDGLFQVTVISAMNPPLVFWHLPKLYNGKINGISRIFTTTGRRVTASSEQRVLLEVDGEQPGTLPAEWEIVPRALQMILPKDPGFSRRSYPSPISPM